MGDWAAGSAVPDLIGELADVCSLIALDGLRDSKGEVRSLGRNVARSGR